MATDPVRPSAVPEVIIFTFTLSLSENELICLALQECLRAFLILFINKTSLTVFLYIHEGNTPMCSYMFEAWFMQTGADLPGRMLSYSRLFFFLE